MGFIGKGIALPFIFRVKISAYNRTNNKTYLESRGNIMFREIRTRERIMEEDERRNREVIDITKRIKPATDAEVESAKDFWNNMFGANTIDITTGV